MEDVDALERKWKRVLRQGRCRVSAMGLVVVCALLGEVCRAWPRWYVTEQLRLRNKGQDPFNPKSDGIDLKLCIAKGL